MRKKGFVPDEVTYNTLLKLCVRGNDMKGANEVSVIISVYFLTFFISFLIGFFLLYSQPHFLWKNCFLLQIASTLSSSFSSLLFPLPSNYIPILFFSFVYLSICRSLCHSCFLFFSHSLSQFHSPDHFLFLYLYFSTGPSNNEDSRYCSQQSYKISFDFSLFH